LTFGEAPSRGHLEKEYWARGGEYKAIGNGLDVAGGWYEGVQCVDRYPWSAKRSSPERGRWGRAWNWRGGHLFSPLSGSTRNEEIKKDSPYGGRRLKGAECEKLSLEGKIVG